MQLRRTPVPVRVNVLAVCIAAGISACGEGHVPLGAAEPARAPALSVDPAGTVRAVGAEPEGIVYDQQTDMLAVAVHDPARLALLEPTTLRLVRSVALPGTVRHLQLEGPGGPVLVPAETAAQLVEVSLPGGATRTTQVGKQPHDASGVAGHDIVVGNEFGHSISILRDGAVLDTLPGVQQPGGVIGFGKSVAVIDVGNFTVSTYDLTTGTRTAVVPAGQGPTHGVPLSRNRLAVSDTRGNALLVFSLSPLKQIGRLALGGAPYGLAVDSADTVWVTLTARNELVGLDVSADMPKLIARLPTVRQPNTVTVSPDSSTIWVTGTDDGVVQRITR